MQAVFLSASVPEIGSGDFYKTANPFLIQIAVREFLIAALGRRLIVWGGHPAITPMVWAACEDLDVAFEKTVILYQSRFFEGRFPEEITRFSNVEYTPAVDGDQAASLRVMRETMLSRGDLVAAVFVGGMKGIFEEHDLFTEFHPNARVLAVAGPGGAARELAERRKEWSADAREDLDFARLFHEGLDISASSKRMVDNEESQIQRVMEPPQFRES
jgi:hypothetical protein